ncbi:MAG: exo-alpha-sialidase, partial [Ignavibacteriales bacterium]
MKNYLLLLIIFSFLYAYPQNQKFQHVPAIYENVTEAVPIVLNDNSIIAVYLNPATDSLYSIKTTDKGSTWGENLFLYKADVTTLQKVSGLMGLKTNSGRLIIALSVLKTITFLSSDDNGASWTKLSTLISTDLYNIQNINLSSLSDNRILLTANASYGRIYYSLSSDNGNNWEPLVRIEIPSSLPFSSSDLNYVQLNSGNIFGIYLKTLSFSRTIYGLSAPPDDLRTPDTTTIFSSAEAIERPRLTKTSDGVLWIIYQLNETTQFPFYKQYDLYYMKSTDNGVSWSEPVKYTKYTGDDYNHNLYPSDSYPLITFSTKRFTNNYQPALAEVGNTTDENYPPFIKRTWHHETDYENQTINIRSEIFYDEPVYTYTLVFFDSMVAGELYDDGLHNDGEANDYTFGNDFNIPDVPVSDQYVMEVNKIILPLNKNGVLADVNSSVRIPAELNIKREEVVYKYKYNFNVWSGHFSGGRFDEKGFLFSSGFFLGGLDNSSLWANGVASASLVNDYQPGIVNSDADDPLNSLYIIRANDPPFGMSWQRWRDAVKLGADFYDGNSDGIYNPVDLNYNGTWDPGDDMPLILGDETIWCVYNDAVLADLRRWDVDPKQIQISQTLFASDKQGFENIIFIRYKIENKSLVDYDSVYF